jgi:hypothetical protein
MPVITPRYSPRANIRRRRSPGPSPSPSDQFHRKERRRPDHQARSSPSLAEDRPQSKSSSAQASASSMDWETTMLLITFLRPFRRHFRASHILMAHKLSMSLHGFFALTMRSISKMTSSENADKVKESRRLYRAQNLIQSRLQSRLLPCSNRQQGQEPSSNLP